MSTFSCHLYLFSSTQYLLGHLIGRSPRPLNNSSVQLPIKIRFAFLPCRGDIFSFCSDFCYGPNDPTLWPQLFVNEYPHLGAIPRQPEDPKDPLSIMWWNPTHNTFFPLDNGVLDGMGQLSTLKYWAFQDISKELKERVQNY